jgi:hypothetical protein
LYQQDFIKRLIRQFTQAVLQIAGLTQAGRLTEAATLLEATYEDLFGLSPTVVFHTPTQELIQLIARGDDDDPQRIFVLAELLRSEARLSQGRFHDFDAHQQRLKSLSLHLEAARRRPDFQSASALEAILDLQSDIQEGGMPPEVQADLFFFFEDMGYYRAALDAITTYLKLADHPDDIRPYLVAFCQRMLDLPEAALVAGGLSHAEVEATLKGQARD